MPTVKVTIGALAGAIVTIVLWIVTASTDVDLPAEAAAAITVVVTFLLSYLVPETSDAPPQV